MRFKIILLALLLCGCVDTSGGMSNQEAAGLSLALKQKIGK